MHETATKEQKGKSSQFKLKWKLTQMRKSIINCNNHFTTKAIHNLLWFLVTPYTPGLTHTKKKRKEGKPQSIKRTFLPPQDYQNNLCIISEQSNLLHKCQCQPLQLDAFMRAFSPPPCWKQVLPRPSAQRLQCASANQQLNRFYYWQGSKKIQMLMTCSIKSDCCTDCMNFLESSEVL